MSIVIEEGHPIPAAKRKRKWNDVIEAFGRIQKSNQSIFLPVGHNGFTDVKRLRRTVCSCLSHAYKGRASVIVREVEGGIRVWKG